MKLHRTVLALFATVVAMATAATAYPGGTPSYQTDAAPYCAGCHSSRSADALTGAGERAQKEVAESKHIASILAGRGDGYGALTEADRKTLAEHIRALDAASTVKLTAPDSVAAGQTFEVSVEVTGGGGPVVAVALVDLAHRWYARPATAAGWTVVGAPRITGAAGQPAMKWLEKRPETLGRNLTFVNIPGVSSDPATKQWGSAKVVFTLRAPSTPGSVPLSVAYFYGTEKSTVLGYTTNAVGRKQVRGGQYSGSGRVMFAPVKQIQVQ